MVLIWCFTALLESGAESPFGKRRSSVSQSKFERRSRITETTRKRSQQICDLISIRVVSRAGFFGSGSGFKLTFCLRCTKI